MDIELSSGMLQWLAHGILNDAASYIRNERLDEKLSSVDRIKLSSAVFEALDIFDDCKRGVWLNEEYYKNLLKEAYAKDK